MFLICDFWVLQLQARFNTGAANIFWRVSKCQIKIIHEYAIIQSACDVLINLKVEEFMHIFHVQVSWKILSARCSMAGIMAGSASKCFNVVFHLLSFGWLFTWVASTTSVLRHWHPIFHPMLGNIAEPIFFFLMPEKRNSLLTLPLSCKALG